MKDQILELLIEISWESSYFDVVTILLDLPRISLLALISWKEKQQQKKSVSSPKLVILGRNQEQVSR